jgi:hypothetical protein
VVISAVSFSTQRIVFSESAVFFGVITEVHVKKKGEKKEEKGKKGGKK